MTQPNKNISRAITHSAIATWGGFVYQGLNAICVVLDTQYGAPATEQPLEILALRESNFKII